MIFVKKRGGICVSRPGDSFRLSATYFCRGTKVGKNPHKEGDTRSCPPPYETSPHADKCTALQSAPGGDWCQCFTISASRNVSCRGRTLAGPRRAVGSPPYDIAPSEMQRMDLQEVTEALPYKVTQKSSAPVGRDALIAPQMLPPPPQQAAPRNKPPKLSARQGGCHRAKRRIKTPMGQGAAAPCGLLVTFVPLQK